MISIGFRKISLQIHKFTWLMFVGIFLFSMLIRIPHLGFESINPDAVNWHYRCQQFANGIKFFQLEKTYPHYHPGVSLCYIMMIPTELYKQISGQIYNSENFMQFNFYNTLSLVIVISLLISWAGVKIGGVNGLIFTFFLSFEPFFYGNSRLIHLDILTSLFLFLGILYLVEYSKSNSFLSLSFVSGFFSLAFLTKSVSIVFIAVSFFIVWYFSRSRKVFRSVNFLAMTLILIVLLFPAMWANPFSVFERIFTEADRVGVRNPHSQFFLGTSYSDDEVVSNLFYLWSYIIKFSPLLVLGTLFLTLEMFYKLYRELLYRKQDWFFFILNLIEKHKVFLIFTSLYLVYLLVLLYSSKKVDRYLLVLVPPIVYYLATKSGPLFRRNFLILGLVNIVSVFYFMPYLFLYYSPVFLSYSNVNQIIGQKSFGQGIYELKNYLVSKFGEVNYGFYDVKPMQSIYPNSKISDIRTTSSNKVDIVILSINETLPENYSKNFVKTETFYLIDIPLYEIYTKNQTN